MTPKPLRRHGTTPITTTRLRIFLIVAGIGREVLINQRTTPTTAKVRTTFMSGMPESSRKCRVTEWGFTRMQHYADVSPFPRCDRRDSPSVCRCHPQPGTANPLGSRRFREAMGAEDVRKVHQANLGLDQLQHIGAKRPAA